MRRVLLLCHIILCLSVRLQDSADFMIRAIFVCRRCLHIWAECGILNIGMKIPVVCFTSFYTLLLVGFSVDTFRGTDMAVKKHMVPWPLLLILWAKCRIIGYRLVRI